MPLIGGYTRSTCLSFSSCQDWYSTLANTLTGGGYLLQKVKTLLIPYVFFAIVSNLIAAAFQTEWLQKYIWADWSLIICNGSHLAVWFLYVLFMVEVLSFFLIKLLKNRGFVLLVLVILAVGSYIMYLKDIHLPYKLEAVGYSSLFFGIGYLFRRYYDSVEKWLIKIPRIYLFVALGVMFMVDVPVSYILKPMLDIGYNDLGVHVFTFLLALWGIVMVAIFSFMLNDGFIKNVFKYLGKNTMVILGFSQVTLVAMKDAFIALGMPNVVSGLLRHALLWTLMVALIYTFNHYLPFLVGKKKPA